MASSSPALSSGQKGKELGWIEWLSGWYHLICEILFQKFFARHLENPFPLPTLTNLTCIVTGATSGIGLEIARQLAEAGAHVVMAVRNTNAAHEIIQRWRNNQSDIRSLDVEVMELDLLSLESVVKFSEAWNSSSRPLNVLINNAGIFSMGQTQKCSKDGYETHLQVNYLAPALLSILLLPSLQRGPPSRIINMNSFAHRLGSVNSTDINSSMNNKKLSSLKAYSSSKLAQVMFSSSLQKHLPADAGIDVLCVDPGAVQTNVARDFPKFIQVSYKLLPNFFDAQEGSRSALFAAIDTDIIKYCRKLKADQFPVCAYIDYNCRPINPSKGAHNVGTSQLVWEKTLEMVGLPSDVVEILLQGNEVNCRYRI